MPSYQLNSYQLVAAILQVAAEEALSDQEQQALINWAAKLGYFV